MGGYSVSCLQKMQQQGAFLEAYSSPHQIAEPAGSLISNFSTSRIVSHKYVSYKLPSLWYSGYSVRVAQNGLRHNQRKQSKIREGKGTWSRAQRKPDASFQMCSLHGTTQHMLSSPTVTCDNMYEVSNDLIRDLCPGFLLGTLALASLCPAYTKIADSRKESRYSA